MSSFSCSTNIDKKRGITLLKKLAEESKIQELIKKGIEKEEDIEKIGRCVRYIALVSKEAGLKIVNTIDIDSLSKNMEANLDEFNRKLKRQ